MHGSRGAGPRSPAAPAAADPAGGGKSNGLGETCLRNFTYRPFDGIAGCAPGELVVPEIHGFGGQLVAIPPDGAVAILLHNNYCDSEEEMTDPAPLLRVLNDIEPICHDDADRDERRDADQGPPPVRRARRRRFAQDRRRPCHGPAGTCCANVTYHGRKVDPGSGTAP